MNIKELVQLVSEAAEGKDSIQKAAIGFNGYGFVFIDFRNSDIPFAFNEGSNKLCAAGSYTDMFFKIWSGRDDGEIVWDDSSDILLAGSLKTLLPTIKFGGYEQLFDVWMFVKTPEDQIFPATLYYKHGTSIGAWHPRIIESFTNKTPEELFTKDFLSVINFWPSDFSEYELRNLIEALEYALRKVPVSDFYGIYEHDFGNLLIGVVKEKPIREELGEVWYDDDVKKVLDLAYRHKIPRDLYSEAKPKNKKPVLDFNVLEDISEKSISVDGTEIFNNLLEGLRGYLRLGVFHSNVKIIFKKGNNNTEINQYNLFDFGVKRDLQKNGLTIEIFEGFQKYLPLILLREAYYCFIHGNLEKKRDVKYIINQITKTQLREFEIIKDWNSLDVKFNKDFDFIDDDLRELYNMLNLEDIEYFKKATRIFFECMRDTELFNFVTMKKRK